MRISLISFHFAEYTFLLADALATDHDVLLMMSQENTTRELGTKLINYNKNRLSIILLPDRKLRNPLFFLNLYNLYSKINKFKPDVIHCQESITDYLIGALLFLREFPLVLTIHDHILHSGQDSQERKRILIYQKYLRHIPDFVIVHGEKIKSESEELMPWLSGKIGVVAHGVLGETPTDNSFSWESGALLFFGRMEQYKGLRYFIEAVNTLGAESIKVKGIIAGTGEDLDNYKDEILNNPLLELIDRYINEDEIPGLFARSNIVVLPYTDATQSGVAAMALSFSRPIISTSVGSIDEIVRDGYNGFLVPPKDTAALVKAVRKLLDNQELSEMMAKNSLNIAINDLSWEKIANETVKVYRLAIKNKSSVE